MAHRQPRTQREIKEQNKSAFLWSAWEKLLGTLKKKTIINMYTITTWRSQNVATYRLCSKTLWSAFVDGILRCIIDAFATWGFQNMRWLGTSFWPKSVSFVKKEVNLTLYSDEPSGQKKERRKGVKTWISFVIFLEEMLIKFFSVVGSSVWSILKMEQHLYTVCQWL